MPPITRASCLHPTLCRALKGGQNLIPDDLRLRDLAYPEGPAMNLTSRGARRGIQAHNLKVVGSPAARDRKSDPRYLARTSDRQALAKRRLGDPWLLGPGRGEGCQLTAACRDFLSREFSGLLHQHQRSVGRSSSL